MFLSKLKRKNKIEIRQAQSLLCAKKKKVFVRANCGALLEKKTTNFSFHWNSLRYKAHYTTIDNIRQGFESDIHSDRIGEDTKEQKSKQASEWGLQIQNLYFLISHFSDEKKDEYSKYFWVSEGLIEQTKIYNERRKRMGKLLRELKQKKLLYVRSPRGSAKSSVTYLLQRQACNEENGFSVVFTLLGTDYNIERGKGYSAFLQKRLGSSSLSELSEQYRGEKPALVIFDDFQQFFAEELLSSDLKAFLSKSTQANVCLLLLATHGEHTLGRDTPTPITFNDDQQKDISLLLLDEQEHLDCINTYKDRSPIGKIIGEVDRKHSLYKLTSGHAGILAAALTTIESEFKNSDLSKLNVRDILNYIYSEGFFDCLPKNKIFNSLDPKEDTSEEYRHNCERGKRELMKCESCGQ